MNCYFCAQQHPGGTNFGNGLAIGACQQCGVGVCLEHGQKKATPGAPLLCFECARFLETSKAAKQTSEEVADLHVNLN